MLAYTTIHPLAAAAFERYCPDGELADVSASNESYWQLLERLWRGGESFGIVEHDIEVTADAIAQAETCACPWGVSPYGGPGSAVLDQSLGCTRFSAQLLLAEPDAMSEVGSIDDAGPAVPLRDWRRIDARLYGVLRQREYLPCIHAGVRHHHVYQGTCACGGRHGEAEDGIARDD